MFDFVTDLHGFSINLNVIKLYAKVALQLDIMPIDVAIELVCVVVTQRQV